ncbi:helix-turn-helix domain-containing protein [Candidatus Enterococcus ferrettii]|uniref:Mga helix-turn-helix domain-containing protein n=1 Tax=Candidatus Enterococcus ferrettii TaxID=2815324 RepID=A0ABV0EUX8_9ENTE|nr:helix-turn-helix domain-containing protein [Enterococcus sp. 665A]
MITLLEQFLAKEEWRKFQIIGLLERSPFFSVSKQEMMDHLEVSSYVLKGVVEALIYDLKRYQLDQAILIIDEDPLIHLKISGEASSGSLLENYVKDSLNFHLLCSAYLQKYNSVNDFSVKELISYPIAYKEYKRLNRFLKENGLQITRKFQLVGENEQNLRLFITELFSRIFKDELSLYNDIDTYLVNQQIAVVPLESFTRYQRNDLIHYNYVTDIRIRQEHYLDETSLPLLNEEIQDQLCFPYFFLRLPASFAAVEKQALVNYYLTRSASLIDQVSVWDETAKDYSQQLIAALIQDFPAVATDHEKIADFNLHLDFLHLQLKELSLGYESLQSAIDISYFQQNYPEILAFCRQYLKSVESSDLYDKKKFVFFNYLLLIVTIFPKEALLHTVKIYTDFYYGELYNQFIEGNLIFFQSAGAVTTNRMEEADILLTDNRALGESSACDYVVWLSPPRPLDWANLGQKIVQQRSKKYLSADEKRD